MMLLSYFAHLSFLENPKASRIAALANAGLQILSAKEKTQYNHPTLKSNISAWFYQHQSPRLFTCPLINLQRQFS
jgi:hypothetical protein